MKVLTVVGARPQFIKAAPVSRALATRHQEVLVHTGQHYDPLLSDVFFQELGLRTPDHALQVGSGPHGAQTGRMLEAVEAVLLAESPDVVLVYGDTNSTLAGALAAAKCHVPVVHVEAGLRSFNRRMPEEVNRVMVDHLSTLCCCPNAGAAAHLAGEGITEGVVVVGDVMQDALLDTRARLDAEGAAALGNRAQAQPHPQAHTQAHTQTHPHAHPHAHPDAHAHAHAQTDTRRDTPRTAASTTHVAPVLVTLHRPSNTDDPVQLQRLLDAVARIARPVLWPVHPRTRDAMAQHGVRLPAHVHMVAPLGYTALVQALSSAHAVVTDSGGLQKEAYWLGTPCLTVRPDTEWMETVHSGWNRLVDVRTDDLAALVESVSRPAGARDAYGAAGAAERVVCAMEQQFEGRARAAA